MVKCKIKKGNIVQLIAGDDKGKKGKVLAVYPKKGTLIVENCKMAIKAVKPNPQKQDSKGGFVKKEMPIHISNVKLVEGSE